VSKYLHVPIQPEAEQLLDEILTGAAAAWLIPELPVLAHNLQQVRIIELAHLPEDDGHVDLRDLTLRLHEGLRRRRNLRDLPLAAQDIKIFSVLFHEGIHVRQGKVTKRLSAKERQQREREACLEEIKFFNRVLDRLPVSETALRAEVSHFRRNALLEYFRAGGKRGKHLERRE
jgi:hypothetical protein